MVYVNQTPFYTTQGRFICKTGVVVGVPTCLGTQQQCGWAAFLGASAIVH